MISDFHVGAGARHSEMDQMVERVAAAKPELILIAGDVCDSASSVADLEYMEETLKKLSCPYGVYYAEGNHEVECRTRSGAVLAPGRHNDPLRPNAG